MEDIFIREIKMPLTVRAFTIPDSNGDYNIYLNIDLSDKTKDCAIKHEMHHINNNDFSSNLSATLIENNLEQSLIY